jgi:glycosyltransferase involved in cell wall biosynthesis
MHILQIIHDRERGGIETLAGMIEAGMSPHHFTFETAYLYPRPGLPPFAKLACALRMMRRIWRRDFDALIAYQATASILVGTVGWLRGCRVRVVHQTCTPSETALPIRWLDKLVGALGLYAANITNSASTWSEFKQYPAPYRRSLVLIEHGLDAPAPTGNRAAARRRFKLPLTQPVLLNVGRLMPQKNQEMLIRALATIPQAHLALAGGGLKDDSYRTLAATVGVADRLHILGPLPAPDIADLYLAADLFVFPSTWETFGLAAVEAAMVGLPMVAADLPVLREVLRGDGTEPVDFVEPHDVEGWASAIRAALAAPPSPRAVAEFAQAMRRKYSRQRMIENYLALFEQQTGSGRSTRPLSDLRVTAGDIRS